MRYLMVAVLALAMVCPAMAADQKIVPGADHSISSEVGTAANAAGAQFVQGAQRVVEPFIVLGRTVIDGVQFIMLKGAQGVIYVAEDMVMGIKWVAKGAKFVIIKTAQGLRWVAVQALEIGEIILDAVCDAAILVIDGVHYVLVQLEDGVIYVAKKTIEIANKVGHAIINGVEYVVHKTVDGIVWVTKATFEAIKKGAAWARERVVIANMRTRLAAALLAGGVGPDTLAYYQSMSVSTNATPGLRKLGAAAYAACKTFNEVYYAPAK